jgi:hypothetical protein
MNGKNAPDTYLNNMSIFAAIIPHSGLGATMRRKGPSAMINLLGNVVQKHLFITGILRSPIHLPKKLPF